MKIIRKRGDTSNILQVFISDSSSTTGVGLTGLVFNTASLTAYYHRDLDTTATAIALVTMTVGTFTSSGFKEIDATNMPGWYQFCPPDAAFGSGTAAHSVGFHLKGATNMAPLPIECQLVAVDVEDATAFGLSRIDAAVSSRMATYTQPTGFLAATFPSGTVANTTNITAGTITTATNVTTLSAGAIANTSFAAGAIDAAAIAADAIGSSELATSAVNEIADGLLGRNIAGGSSAGRIVTDALSVLRNKVDITAGIMTVYATDDSSTQWTAAVTTTAGNPISQVDPA